ncbi:MAG: uroporphyrinogen-III synthase, partial [Deltaproteobacteria bacterium]|nr:uroporphyrinogen-III synthase [Deltaproteobacteria bacterium]
GRGGEEAEVLVREGIPIEVIPGVTSATSVPAFAGIPLTHREHTSTVAFVTGHEDPTKKKSEIDWEKLSGIGTIVFLMGVKNLPGITKNLIEGGKAPTTPAALIRQGTTPDQETLTGTLGDIAKKAAREKFTPPAILVVGDVVSLRKKLNWFEDKPLFGKGIVVTRPEDQAGEFAALLLEEGARVIRFPTIEIAPPESWEGLDRAIDGIESYDWIIFTSANGVRFFFSRLQEGGRDVRDLKGLGICTIGPATARVIEERGLRVDIVPDEYISEGIVAAFKGKNLKGKKILLPRAEVARDVVPEGLKKLGAAVDVVTVYRTVRSGYKKSDLQPLMDAGKVDVITFTSPSTVINFKLIMGKEISLPEKVKIACLGPVTAAAAKKHGFSVDIFQAHYTIPGMVKALADYFVRSRPSASG